MTFIPYCNKTLKELGIEDEQGFLDLVKLKVHIRDCIYCGQFLLLLGEGFIDDMIYDFGRWWKVK